jgi:hypothetical protein
VCLGSTVSSRGVSDRSSRRDSALMQIEGTIVECGSN